MSIHVFLFTLTFLFLSSTQRVPAIRIAAASQGMGEESGGDV